MSASWLAGMASAWHSRLWRKTAWVLAGLAAVGALGFGGAESYLSVAAAREQAGQLQLAQAREVAQAIRFALLNIDRHVGAVTALPWVAGDWLNLDTRREEYGRLLRLVPAIESVALRDAGGAERLFVSRREVDRMVRADAPPAAAAPPRSAAASSGAAAAAARAFGAVSYRDNYEPVLDVEVAYAEPAISGQTVVRINLRALALELQAPLSRAGSQVYAVDRSGTVVLHRDADLLLARLPSPLAAPGAAAVEPGAGGTESAAQPGRGLDGAEVMRSVSPIAEVGWRIVVEQPRDAVLAPVWATLRRTALFFALGLLLAGAGALYLAQRMTQPIRALHQGVLQLGAGRLDTAIAIRTGDELEDLAAQFNRMAAAVRASVTDLEERIAERTMDLQRANLHKSEFLANMSHELRTPLNAILGFADVLNEGMAGPLADEQREYIQDIHASGLHLLSLINDVLDLSKIEAGQLELETAEFDVPEVVAAAAALVRQRAAKKGLRLDLALAPEVGSWVGDARRIKQVLLNLLTNAVKFTPSGGSVTVAGGVDAAEGLWVEVRDSGIGIDPADHDTVFQAFRQVGSDSAGRAEGTGLGLALVRRLVEQHQGRVTLSSSLGAGAVFRFNLPRSAA